MTCFVGECGTFYFIWWSHPQVLFHTLGWLNRIYRLNFLARHVFHVQLRTQTPVDTLSLKMMKNENLWTTNDYTPMLDSIWKFLDFSSCPNTFFTFVLPTEIFQQVFCTSIHCTVETVVFFWQHNLWFLFKHFNPIKRICINLDTDTWYFWSPFI